MKNEKYTDLENRIYKTWRSRIKSADRYKEWNSFLEKINMYYSLFVVVLSIWNLNNNTNTYRTSLVLLIISVIAFTFTTFITSLNYREKANDFKSNYLSLGELYSDLLLVGDTNTPLDDELITINKKYNDILENYSNHKDIDYYNFLYNDKDKFSTLSDDFKKSISDKVIKNNRIKLGIKILFIIAPWLTPLFISLIDKFLQLC